MDRYYAKDYCRVEGNHFDSNETAIQREIMAHGSVTAKLTVYKSFKEYYGTGVYKQSWVYIDPNGQTQYDQFRGYHAVKLVSTIRENGQGLT